ncbi:MAG: ABC transporter substrate-binding protein [Crocosphaera sp.]|nr:ABC transporter substrate-binding protein [Crocosphaera sp.]
MNKTLIIVFAILSTIGSLTVVILLWEFVVQPALISDNDTIPNPPPTTNVSPPSPPPNDNTNIPRENRFSSGDSLLFTNTQNPEKSLGITEFKARNYEQAIKHFQEAINQNPNDPEVQIYLNNAEAQKKGNPFTLAAVVPVTNRQTTAEEMLRGIAQSQTKFNQIGLQGRLLEIIIVNDSNDPSKAQEVAEKIVKNPNILGVIGHNTSSASSKGLEVYEQAGIAMISPTSTSTSLSASVFFRTVPSDAKAGEFLARYALNNNLNSVAIFYNSKSNYSQSLKDAFVKDFSLLGTPITQDMSDSSFNAQNMVKTLENRVDGFALFPNADNQIINFSLTVAKANSQLSSPKKLLGGDVLYNPATLKLSQGGVEGLVLAIPWFAKTSYPYTNSAAKRWGGRVSWRTATSYDAAQAFINALSDNATRNTILNSLRLTNLSSSETSGEPLRFFSNGDRNTAPLLVRVIRKSSQFADYDFQIINE